ncbi:MAG: hypothetical protein AB7I30_12445 [Isosphaeraceae bacterium]
MERYRGILFGSVGLVASLAGCAGLNPRLAEPGGKAQSTGLVTRASAARERVAVRDDVTQRAASSSEATEDAPPGAEAPRLVHDDHRSVVSERVARYFPMFQRPTASLGRSAVDAQVPEDLWAEAARAGANKYLSERDRGESSSPTRRPSEPPPRSPETSVLPVALQIETGEAEGGRPRIAVVPGPIEGRPRSLPVTSSDDDLRGRPRALTTTPEWAVPAAKLPTRERPRLEPDVVPTAATESDLLELAQAVTYDEPATVAERAAAYEPDVPRVGMAQAPAPRRPLTTGAPPPVPAPDLPTPAPLTRPSAPRLPTTPVTPVPEPSATPPPPQAPATEPAPIEVELPQAPKPEAPTPVEEPAPATEPVAPEMPEKPEPAEPTEPTEEPTTSTETGGGASAQAPAWTLPPGASTPQGQPAPTPQSSPGKAPEGPLVTYLPPRAASKTIPAAVAAAPSKTLPKSVAPTIPATVPSKVPPARVAVAPGLPPIPSKTLPVAHAPATVRPELVGDPAPRTPMPRLRGLLSRMFGRSSESNGRVVVNHDGRTLRPPSAEVVQVSAKSEDFAPGWGPRPTPSRYAKVSPLGAASTPDSLFPVAYYAAQNQPDLALAEAPTRPRPQPQPQPQPRSIPQPGPAPEPRPEPALASTTPDAPASYWWDRPTTQPRPTFMGRLMARLPWNAESSEAHCSCDCHRQHGHDRAPAPPAVPQEAVVRRPVPSPSILPKPGDLTQSRDVLHRVSADGLDKAPQR